MSDYSFMQLDGRLKAHKAWSSEKVFEMGGMMLLNQDN